MRSSGNLNSLVFAAIVTLFLTLSVPSQSKKCRAESADRSVRCANLLVEYPRVSTSRLTGKVDWPGDVPLIVEVYRIDRSERKLSSYDLTKSRVPTHVFETDPSGSFCHPGLPEGYYVVRFGTDDGGWNCTWIKVRIANGLPKRTIRATLEIGI
ncbi:MAG TPA: hypothetical protein PLN05_07165 [Pyrinomonadaceae bacterium]|nr:hypothetical protein [Chloracidobacterium sp.]HRJ89095.1 hypothetical protein [Pyrinomonadaceae bacterium]HRK50194.1 hypothetical protein [Pyrinomonadaceae bacterium]